MEREKLASRLGFILLSAGCAIGLGNVWKFPYMTGQYGGGIFVLIYIFFLAALGIPAMTMEFAIGRAAQSSPVRFYKALNSGKIWHIHGYLAFFGNYLLMMFYTGVAGWMLDYFVKMASGTFNGLSPQEVGAVFGGMLGNPAEIIFYMIVVVFGGFAVCAAGLQNGSERINKFMMMALLLVMLMLVVNSFSVDGGIEGLKFFLLPDVDRFMAIGPAQVVLGALNQAFFTLSIGIGNMAIFGSYIDKDRRLLGESVNVAALDTFVAISAGLIIFPACFAFGIKPDAGPSLIFITLPNVFNHMAWGQFWGALFFVFMSFAAFSTVVGVFENIVSCTKELFGCTRKAACLGNAVLLSVLSAPCMLGFNLWSSFQPFGKGSCVLDLEDFILSNILLPLGALIFVLFCTWKHGWGWDNFTAEANAGKGLKIQAWMRPVMSYIMPVIILVIWIAGFIK